MKLLTKLKTTCFRTVYYFGLRVELASTEEYVATDDNGYVFAYESKPITMGEYWREDDYCRELFTVDLEGMSWDTTLLKFPKI